MYPTREDDRTGEAFSLLKRRRIGLFGKMLVEEVLEDHPGVLTSAPDAIALADKSSEPSGQEDADVQHTQGHAAYQGRTHQNTKSSLVACYI